jgi:hypothetical protein
LVEPIARLYLEGGYDSNVLYIGQGGGGMGRISPDVGLKLRDHEWSFIGTVGGEYTSYPSFTPSNGWNERGALELTATPSPRLALDGKLYGSYAFDPVGLAQIGIFRTDERRALLLIGTARADWRFAPRLDLGATLTERTVRFQNRTGGAMHRPEVEGLWRLGERLSLGAGYSFGVFQSFNPDGTVLAFANGLLGRARWYLSRETRIEAAAGPTIWSGPDGRSVVPEAGVELLRHVADLDLRVSARHTLGIGTTARPALIDAFEVGAEKRFGRLWIIHADGGLWHSGIPPTGADATVGYAVSGEAALLIGRVTRVGIVATHYAQVTDPSPSLRRTTVGLRVGWELETR